MDEAIPWSQCCTRNSSSNEGTFVIIPTLANYSLPSCKNKDFQSHQIQICVEQERGHETLQTCRVCALGNAGYLGSRNLLWILDWLWVLIGRSFVYPPTRLWVNLTALQTNYNLIGSCRSVGEHPPTTLVLPMVKGDRKKCVGIWILWS